MKLFFFVIVIWCDICSSVVITDFRELENLYYSRKLEAENNEDKQEDPFVKASEEFKEKECKELFNANYFVFPGLEEYGDKNTEEVFKIISEDPVLKTFHYKIKNKGGPKTLDNFKPYYSYKHKYELTLNKISQKVFQKMFPCLAIKKFSRRLVHYYIAYGFVAGERFLFGHDIVNGSLMLKALVELAPVWVQFDSNRKLQEFYIKQRETAETNPLLKNKPDLICKLKDYEKLRLCSLVFDVDYYKNHFKFMANSRDVEYACKNRKIALDKTFEKEFKENMIGCIVISDDVSSRSIIKYQISQVFNGEASVFVFKTIFSQKKFKIPFSNSEKKNYVLDAYLRSITVLMEQPNEIFFDAECCSDSNSRSVEVT